MISAEVKGSLITLNKPHIVIMASTADTIVKPKSIKFQKLQKLYHKKVRSSSHAAKHATLSIY